MVGSRPLKVGGVKVSIEECSSQMDRSSRLSFTLMAHHALSMPSTLFDTQHGPRSGCMHLCAHVITIISTRCSCQKGQGAAAQAI